MSRQSRVPNGTQPPAGEEALVSPDAGSLPSITDGLLFKPTGPMRTLKAKFIVRTQDNPLIDFDSMTQRDQINLVGHKQLVDSNWSRPGFKEWLFNREEGKEKLEELFDMALDSVRQVLLSEDVKTASAKVNILKVLGDLLDKFPKPGQSHKDPMANLSKEELEKFLEKSGIRIEKQIILDAGPNK
jgi:hypothetical protein